MSKIVYKENYEKSLSLCNKGKHKLRENKFGIVWCTRCGLLSNSVGTVQLLQEDDKILIENK
jgi:hypothetical protein